MTLDELRDWHAKRVGWTKVPAHPSLTGWGEEWWKYTISESHGGRTWGKDPFPATLDGAASSMPPGWRMDMVDWPMDPDGQIIVAAYKMAGAGVSATGPDEIIARYALAKLAWEAEAKENP